MSGVSRLLITVSSIASTSTDQPIQFGSVIVDIGHRLVTVGGQDVHLMPIEYELLKHLTLNAGRVLTHQVLLERVWGPKYHPEVHYLRPVITSLRKKLGPNLIQTESGVGYRLKVT